MEERFEMFTLLISKCSRAIRKIKTEEVVEFNLKSPHVSVLYYLYRSKNGLTAKEICDICEEDKALVSRSIVHLEKEGLIVCESKCEKRYKSPLTLTEKGLVVAKEVAKKIAKVLDVSSVGLSEEKRAIFYEGLNVIANNLQKICDNYGEKNEN